MPGDTAQAPVHTAYRRQARRLRHVYRNRPAELHLGLRELAQRHDAEHHARASKAVFDPPGAGLSRSDPAHRFARQVSRQMSGPVLNYSQRLNLLHSAEAAGLSRFDANLIIAAVQNEAGTRQRVDEERRQPRFRLPPTSVLAFVVVQLVIVLTAWHGWRILYP